MGKVLTVGEPMVMFVANDEGDLSKVDQFTKFIAGAEVNVATGVSRLGHDISYLTALGQDPFGEYIVDFLKNEEIDTSLVKYNPNFPTGFQIKNKVSVGDPQVVYFRKGSAASKITQADVVEIDFSDVDVLHLTGIFMALNEETYETTLMLIEKARKHDVTITFDPNLRPVLWESEVVMREAINYVASLCDIVMPGFSEAVLLTGKTTKEEIADFYLDKGVQEVIIKLGTEGSYSKKRAGEQFVEVFEPSFTIDKVVDTVGAGDGFAVGVITSLLENLETDKMLERANAIGAIQVMHISDNENLPTPKRLNEFLNCYQKVGV